MKRRNFIKTNVRAAGAMGLPAVLPSHTNPNEQEPEFFKEENLATQILDETENEFLKFSITEEGVVTVFDKINQYQWKTSAVAVQEYGPIDEGYVWLRQTRSMLEQYPGRFSVKKNEKVFEFTLLGRQLRVMGKFTATITLDKDSLLVKVLTISGNLNSLVFPAPFVNDAVVLPIGIGKIIRKPESGNIYSRYAHTFFTHLNMRWIGGLKEGNAWIAIYEDGFEDAGCVVVNRNVSPAYMQTLGEWKHPFVIRYKFIKGDYVQLAKSYRSWCFAHGLFRTLNDKMKSYPELKKLVGGKIAWINLAMAATRNRDAEDYLLTKEQVYSRGKEGDVNIYLSYKQALERFEQFKKDGLKKGLIKVAGWINKGYDGSHPDVWPPEPTLGSIEDFKKLLSPDPSIAMGLHDNYLDMYEGVPSWPKGLNITKRGEYLVGGIWAGGQAYILNSIDSLYYAKRNWEWIKTVRPEAMFVDTTTATQLYQSYEKKRPTNKATDLKHRIEQLKFFKEQGVLYGSEEVADFAIPYIDWYETRHTRNESEYIPLWPLVFHDAAFVVRYNGNGKNERYGYPGLLEDMLWGYMGYFSNKGMDATKEFFEETAKLDQWHEEIATDEMISHRFLTADYKVEQTQFSSGKSIIVNFSKEAVTINGQLIDGFNYIIHRG